MPDVEFPEHQIQLRDGDLLVLYTDGVTEAFNPADEAYGTERLIDEIRAHGAGTAAGLLERICHSVTVFAGAAPQSDDITLIALSWNRTAAGALQ
jgi:sigma-B regulation protein RsbU (phosphoserine phosphatase)